MTKWEYLTAPILTHAAKQILDTSGAFGSFIPCPWTSGRAQMQKTVWCHCG